MALLQPWAQAPREALLAPPPHGWTAGMVPSGLPSPWLLQDNFRPPHWPRSLFPIWYGLGRATCGSCGHRKCSGVVTSTWLPLECVSTTVYPPTSHTHPPLPVSSVTAPGFRGSLGQAGGGQRGTRLAPVAGPSPGGGQEGRSKLQGKDSKVRNQKAKVEDAAAQASPGLPPSCRMTV